MKQWMVMAGLLAGCATAPAPTAGPTVVRVTREVQLYVDGARLQEGEHATVARRVCRPLTPKTTAQSCANEEIDVAEVVRVLADGSAVVRLAGDADVRPGDQWLLASREPAPRTP